MEASVRSPMVRVFCDFDGTTASHDVGEQLFRTFAGAQAVEIVRGYLDGSITAQQCLRRECAAVESASPEELERFIEQFALDPHFKEFVVFCEARGIPLVILSDGLDFYVGRMLRRNGLERLPFFANHLEFSREGPATKLVPSFPYTDSECDQCANCKRNHLLTLSADDDIIVYVGDGMSDRCPVRYADVVFAKRGLIKHCQQQNISYHEFRHFGDVRTRLEQLLQRKRIKKRREAEMARREVFLQG
jgi:2-hydroxy-3-keto-5-methylthiopentenyl-1-phosphate phosphatase